MPQRQYRDPSWLEQVGSLRGAEKLELREPDGILLRPSEARVVELEGVVPPACGRRVPVGRTSSLLAGERLPTDWRIC